MKLRSIMLVAAAILAFGGVAQATEPNVLAPYRFEPPPPNLSPLEQQKALVYRSQIQNQLRQLEQQRSLNGPKSVDPWLLQDTRRELDRMNGVVQP